MGREAKRRAAVKKDRGLSMLVATEVRDREGVQGRRSGTCGSAGRDGYWGHG